MHPVLPPDALDALDRGDKIEAIKITRQHTGLGLKEAKELVERIEATPRTHRPGMHPPATTPAHGQPPHRPGLAPGEVPRGRFPIGLVVAVLAALAAAVWLFRR